MFVSLDKGNEGQGVALAEIDEDEEMVRLKLRDRKRAGKLGYVPLYAFELEALCKRAIKKKMFRKEDL